MKKLLFPVLMGAFCGAWVSLFIGNVLIFQIEDCIGLDFFKHLQWTSANASDYWALCRDVYNKEHAQLYGMLLSYFAVLGALFGATFWPCYNLIVPKRWRHSLWAAVFILPLFEIVCTSFLWQLSPPVPHFFISERWKSKVNDRREMIPDLVSGHHLKGKKRAEVLKLLGEPAKPFKEIVTKPDDLIEAYRLDGRKLFIIYYDEPADVVKNHRIDDSGWPEYYGYQDAEESLE